MTVSTASSKGGAWLLESADAAAVFTPEKMSEEQRLIGRTADQFVRQEVLPQLDRLERKDWAFARELLRRCGDLGLLGTDVPERYGGVELDKVSSAIVAGRIALSPSFGATYGAQVNLATLAITLFGNDGQKQQYLPRLVTGELVGAYALSEAASGSDALSAKAHAARRPDGGFVLNGETLWITNGGFADVFVVFAKVDGELFTAFIVERSFPGVSSGKEEHKMGLHGSSTTPLILQDVRVPPESVLGEIGKGHKVAFNVLNFGRLKLAASCIGGAAGALAEAARYAVERRQFGQPIGSFGAIKSKLARMTVQTYATESLIYRTAGAIDVAIGQSGSSDSGAALAALEEFAVEASIAKVTGSEALEFVLDENIQIHGGNGYVADYPAERHYRDARVNRIFEGTNEINRLLIPGMLMRRAVKGGFPLIPAARALQEELLSGGSHDAPGAGPLEAERLAIDAFKKVAVLTLGAAMQAYGERAAEEQEILLDIADVLINTYAAESALFRAMNASALGLPNTDLHIDAVGLCVFEAAGQIELAARQALAAMAEGDTQRLYLAALRRFLKVAPVNTVVPRRRLAEQAMAKGGYIFQ